MNDSGLGNLLKIGFVVLMVYAKCHQSINNGASGLMHRSTAAVDAFRGAEPQPVEASKFQPLSMRPLPTPTFIRPLDPSVTGNADSLFGQSGNDRVGGSRAHALVHGLRANATTSPLFQSSEQPNVSMP